ncbi:hypothetical protein ACNFJ7_17010 [Sphingomonas sp. HT-1]|uniref:hypothetical protein n=1 Tax=unclassified Sphingomonas TaxID=196159 RepID=UPI0002DB2077|nr:MULTISPECIES: hypothetical protein [unclassified Sphingomonas]KTF70645.1 hypothetical protein ATB93_03865 [Sphingomonas sp. WG]
MSQPFREDRRYWFAVAAGAALLVSGCASEPAPPPPPTLIYADLPVRGSLADARRAGFDNCIRMDGGHLRCRRSGVMLLGQGPYEAALDLAGGDGSGGFRQITFWHDRDQSAVLKVGDALKQQGWAYSYTGDGSRGDQMVLTRKGAPVRFSIDLSYWGKRRVRILPA